MFSQDSTFFNKYYKFRRLRKRLKLSFLKGVKATTFSYRSKVVVWAGDKDCKQPKSPASTNLCVHKYLTHKMNPNKSIRVDNARRIIVMGSRADNLRVRVLSHEHQQLALQALNSCSGDYLYSQEALLTLLLFKASKQALTDTLKNNTELLWSTSGTVLGYRIAGIIPAEYRSIPEAVFTTLFGIFGNQIPITCRRLQPIWPRINEKCLTSLGSQNPLIFSPLLNVGNEQYATASAIKAITETIFENVSQTGLDLSMPSRIKDVIQFTIGGTVLGTQLGSVLPYLGKGRARSMMTSFLSTTGGLSFARIHDAYSQYFLLNKGNTPSLDRIMIASREVFSSDILLPGVYAALSSGITTKFLPAVIIDPIRGSIICAAENIGSYRGELLVLNLNGLSPIFGAARIGAYRGEFLESTLYSEKLKSLVSIPSTSLTQIIEDPSTPITHVVTGITSVKTLLELPGADILACLSRRYMLVPNKKTHQENTQDDTIPQHNILTRGIGVANRLIKESFDHKYNNEVHSHPGGCETDSEPVLSDYLIVIIVVIWGSHVLIQETIKKDKTLDALGHPVFPLVVFTMNASNTSKVDTSKVDTSKVDTSDSSLNNSLDVVGHPVFSLVILSTVFSKSNQLMVQFFCDLKKNLIKNHVFFF